MITFIRHAQSQYNSNLKDYVTTNKITADWQHLSKEPHFLNNIKFSYTLLDASITHNGTQQCIRARQKLEGMNPDLILVSPLNRTLQTYRHIFHHIECPVIAEPLLAQGIRSACDYSSQVQLKKGKYSQVYFEKVEARGPFWFLSNQSHENQRKYNQALSINHQGEYPEKMTFLLQFMKNSGIYELPSNIRNRTKELKKLLLQYGKKYKNIVVVSHYNIIRFTLAKQFDKNDEPDHFPIANCQIIRTSLDKL